MTDAAPQPSHGPTEVALTPDEVRALQDAGRSWSSVPRAQLGLGAGLDPDLDVREERGRRGERYVRVVRAKHQGFEKVAAGWIQATHRASEPVAGFARVRRRLRTIVLGTPLATSQAAHERLTKLKALAVLSSDALSSVAYATEQIVYLLAPASVAAYSTTPYIAGAILLLLAIVVLSYRQTIRAYPKGGGSYIVASDNLGHLAGLTAGCALMTSYTMTVAVSVASGKDQIVSSAPGLAPYSVPICIGFIVLLMLGNLRGIRESGSIFMAPTYLFIVSMYAMILTVGVKLITGHVALADLSTDPALNHASSDIPIFIVLRAFASGASALTGVEAISDGVPAFKPVEWKNARTTLTTLGIVLGTMFIGITVCAYKLGITALDSTNPKYESVISQLAHIAFGAAGAGGVIYLLVIIATTAILVLAGNTAFSDFPRLLFFMARDQFAPHQFKRLGDRLAYSNGIITLGVLSSLVVWAFNANVTNMIPLYAIGVFTAFTMSQAGMVARWLRLRGRGWRKGLAMNSLGVTITFLVFAINAITKFSQGAWIIILLVPVLVAIAFAIHKHYLEVNDRMATETPTSPQNLRPVSIVPIADLNPIALQSLALARSISDRVIAVHVCDDELHIARLRLQWQAWGNHVPLEIIESPYRSFLRPFLAYIDALDKQRGDDTLIIVLPELVATRWWHQLLHNQTALRLKAALLFRPGTVVINVPYHLKHTVAAKPRSRRHRPDDDDPEAI